MFPTNIKHGMGQRIGFSNPERQSKEIVIPEKTIIIPCPLCGTSLNISEPIYYTDHGDGCITKDAEIEWECPNECTFDDDMILKMDATIERLVCTGSLLFKKKTIPENKVPESDVKVVKMNLKDAIRRMRDKERINPARRLPTTMFEKQERRVVTEAVEELKPVDELLEFMNIPHVPKKGRWTKHRCPTCGRNFKQYSFSDSLYEMQCRTCNPRTQ